MVQLPEKAQEVLAQFSIGDEALRQISEAMLSEFKLGLAKGRPDSSVAMLPTFVPSLPTHQERGKFVAIDLSGKNLRIMLLQLDGPGKDAQISNRNFMVPQSVMIGTGDQLFNFITNCLAKFVTEQELADVEQLPIGFVFSYPCELLSIRSAHLLWWTKGFNVVDCLQKDVVKLLEDAMQLNPATAKARVVAVLNDTVGQLASSAWEHGSDAVVGVVIGYGCNASYLESVDRIPKFDPVSHNYPHPNMVVDTEWEEFGAKGELAGILTAFDKDIDMHSVHVGKQIVDKLCGALYLGELVRGVMEQLVVDGVLFSGQPADSIQMTDAFPAKYISEILRDEETVNWKNTRRILDELEIPLHGSSDYVVIRELCHAVSQRSAAIAAAAIAALLRHLGRQTVTVGVGGVLAQFHPTYLALLQAKLDLLAPPDVQWKVVTVPDGSSRGAAFVAATVSRLQL